MEDSTDQTKLPRASSARSSPDDGSQGLADLNCQKRSTFSDTASTYEPLQQDEIRILELQPGCFEAEICCHLTNKSMKVAVDAYEAISYVWGDANDTVTISCKGAPGYITRSLHGALKHLRHTGHVRYLWADALCINQCDQDEKSQQVQRMGDIYASASRVLIWLGEETSEVKGALERHPTWLEGEVPHVHWDLAHVRWSSPTSFDFNASGQSASAIAWLRTQQTVLPPIMHLFNRPWWRRKWVIQELVRAKNALLICGSSTLPWSAAQGLLSSLPAKYYAMCQIASQYSYLDTRSLSDSGIIDNVGRRFDNNIANAIQLAICVAAFRHGDRHGPKRLELFVILWMSRDFGCSDARDVLYSLLGIAQDIDTRYEHLLRVDYKQSVELIATNLTIYLIRTLDDPLACFSYISGTPDEDGDLQRGVEQPTPSWVIALLDPDVATRADFIDTLKSFDFDVGNRELHGPPSWKLSADRRVLSIRGLVIGQIASIEARPLLQPFSRSCHVSKLQPWVQTVWQTVQRCAAQQNMPELELLFELLICGGRRSHIDHPLWTNHSIDKVQRWLDCVLHERYVYADGPSSHADPEVHAFDLSQGPARTRQLCIMSSGHVGWFPPPARKDDMICVFPGAKVPHVIRPCGEQYHLIGTCYIQGLMYGEALEMGIEEEWIELV